MTSASFGVLSELSDGPSQRPVLFLESSALEGPGVGVPEPTRSGRCSTASRPLPAACCHWQRCGRTAPGAGDFQPGRSDLDLVALTGAAKPGSGLGYGAGLAAIAAFSRNYHSKRAILFHVLGPTIPSGLRPYFCWKSLTAQSVRGPNTPSMAIG